MVLIACCPPAYLYQPTHLTCILPLPPCSSPTVEGKANSPTTGTITVTPPPGGPWKVYSLLLCPVRGPEARCITITCAAGTMPSTCPASGLSPRTSYVVQASARVELASAVEVLCSGASGFLPMQQQSACCHLCHPVPSPQAVWQPFTHALMPPVPLECL